MDYEQNNIPFVDRNRFEPVPLPTQPLPTQQNVVAGGQTEGLYRKLNSTVHNRRVFWLGLSTILFIVILSWIGFIITKANVPQNQLNNASYPSVAVSLKDITTQQGQLLSQVDQLNINGELLVNGGLVIAATAIPQNPTTGQVYLDKTTSNLFVYNGTKFNQIATTTNSVTDVGGYRGSITVGDGLDLTNGVLSSDIAVPTFSGVNSLQGRTGVVTLTAGSGITISDTTITNSGVTRIGSATGAITLGRGLQLVGQALSNNLTVSSGSADIIVNELTPGNYTVSYSGSGMSGTVALGPVAAQVDNSNNPSVYVNKTANGDLLHFEYGGIDQFVVDQDGDIVAGTINGATISGGTLSGGNVSGGSLTTTAVNGVNTASILTVESDPVWIAAETNYFNLGQNETVNGRPAFNGGTSGSTAPFSVDSTYSVTNLNADLLDGQHATYFQVAGSYLTAEADTLGTVTSRGATTATASSFNGGLTANTLTVSTLSTAGIVTNTSGGVLGTVAIIPLANGGSNANLSASNGGIVWTNATQMQILSGTATAGQCLLSGSNTTPSWGSCPGGGGMANPMTTLGDIIYGAASGTATRLGGNTSATKYVLSSTGDGSNATVPTWSALTAGDVGGVPTSRTLTINGTTLDLSANRSWSVGTGDMLLGTSQSVTALKTFDNSMLAMKATGANVGVTTIANANASASNYTITLPATTGTVALTSQLGSLHDAVTLGTANGLGLSTQQLSLGLASSGVTGALSGTDWNTFNSKQPAGSYLTAEADTLASVTGRGATTATASSFNGGLTANTLTVSGLATAGLVTNTSGGVLGTVAIIPLANGGTNANLSASNGGIVWTNATQMQILSGTATAGQCLLSGSNTTPSWGSCGGGGGMTNPMTTLGDIIYGAAGGAATRLGGNTLASKYVLSSTGDGSNATVPTWSALTAGDVGGVPTSRTLTINGTTLDLSANRSWSVGTGDMLLGTSQSVTALKTFDNSMLAMKATGANVGVTTIANANASASNYTITLPATTGTVALTSQLGSLHDAVTLGTANGLGLSTQQLSLGLASSGVTGALSGTDWNTFNSKQPAGSYLTAEADTLASVTGRGATTATASSFNGGLTANTLTVSGLATAGLVTNTSGGVLGTVAIIPLANGGTNANLSASNGGIVWTNATQMQVLAGTATAGQCLLSGSNTTPSWGSCGGGGGANTSLNNLTATAINASLIGDTNNSYDLGSDTLGWKDIYSRTLKLDGSTSGTTTIQAAVTAGTNTLTLPTATGTLAINRLTTNGDLLYHDGSSDTRLAKGTDGQCLTSNSSTVLWGSCGSSGSYTAGNGLTLTAGMFKLGGTLTADTTVTQGNYGMNYNISGTGNFNIQHDAVSAFYVADGGNVGLGTTSPSYKLDVYGSGHVTDLMNIDNGATLNSSSINNPLTVNKNLISDVTAAWSAGVDDTSGVGRHLHSTVVYNNKMYVFGGYSNGTPLNTMRIYDFITSSWSAGVSDTSGGVRYDHSAVVYNNKMYVFGGFDNNALPTNTMRVYDFATSTWSAGISDGLVRYGHTAVVYNNKMYVFGGTGDSSILDTMSIYDFIIGSWTTGMADTGNYRRDHSAVVYNNKMYVFGGDNSGSLNTMRVYDFAANYWTAGTADVGYARQHHTAVVYNNKMYVFGDFSTGSTDLRVYNFTNNTWSAGTAGSVGKSCHTAVVFNNKMYIFGGLNGGSSYTIQIYDFGNRQTIFSVQENNVSTLSFMTGSVMNLDSGQLGIMNGNVGIGTSTPTYKLEVIGTSHVSGLMNIDNGTTLNSSGSNNPLTINKNLMSDTAAAWSASNPDTGNIKANYSAVIYNSRMYVFGGYNGGYLATMRIYDFSTGLWSEGVTDTGNGRAYHSAVAYNNKMYVFGGYNGSAVYTMRVFDFATSTWSAGTSDSVGGVRQRHSAAVYGGKMYVYGGDDGSNFFDTMRVYDFTAGTWSAGTTDSGGNTKSYHTAVIYGAKMYIFGGYNGEILSTMRVYDFAATTWSAGNGDGANTRYNHSAVAYNNKMYVFGGMRDPSYLSSIRTYDFITGSWSDGTTDGSNTRAGHSAITYNNKMYAFGGYNGSYLADVRIYDFGQRQTILAVQENGVDTLSFRSGNTLNLDSGRLNVTNGYLDLSYNGLGYAARIYNASTATSAGDPANSSDGLLITLGTANASRTTGNYFIAFAGSSSNTVAGKIQGGASAVAYTTNNADYGEYFKADETNLPQPGEIVELDSTGTQAVRRSTGNAQQTLAGVVSSSSGFIGNGPICQVDDNNCDANYAKYNVLVGLVGQVNTKVNTSNGPIAIGDPITVSSTPGVGAKATQASYIVGYAQEALASGEGTIRVLIRPQYYTPSNQELGLLQATALNLTGDATIAGNVIINNRLDVNGMATVSDLEVTGTATIHTLAVLNRATVQYLSVIGPAEFSGDIRLTASVNTKQAIIKDFISSGPIAAGSVVVLDSTKDGYVTTTSTEGDTRIIGVAVDAAMQVGDKIQVATGGSVQVLVDPLTAVASGDMVVTAPQTGLAKAKTNPAVGSLLGKATSAKDVNGLVWILIILQ